MEVEKVGRLSNNNNDMRRATLFGESHASLLKLMILRDMIHGYPYDLDVIPDPTLQDLRPERRVEKTG